MRGYAKRYVDADPVIGYIANPWRVLIGMFVAPAVGALPMVVPAFSFDTYRTVALLGWLSVITLYLPLILWRLPHSRHPFWTCVLIGGLSAPGLLGYVLSIIAMLSGMPTIPLFVMVMTFPLGAIGGAVFWLCAVWRSGWDQPRLVEQPFADSNWPYVD